MIIKPIEEEVQDDEDLFEDEKVDDVDDDDEL